MRELQTLAATTVMWTEVLKDEAASPAAQGLTLRGEQCCRHVIIETNKTTARIFPQVPDCENDLFWERMENLVQLNQVNPFCRTPDAPDGATCGL